MAKCADPRGWPKRPPAVTILGACWPKTPSEVTAAKDASSRARQKPRSRRYYSRLRLLFTSRSSPPGHFLSSPRHFRGPFWPAPFQIRHRRRVFWPFGPFLPSAVTTLNNYLIRPGPGHDIRPHHAVCARPTRGLHTHHAARAPANAAPANAATERATPGSRPESPVQPLPRTSLGSSASQSDPRQSCRWQPHAPAGRPRTQPRYLG